MPPVGLQGSKPNCGVQGVAGILYPQTWLCGDDISKRNGRASRTHTDPTELERSSAMSTATTASVGLHRAKLIASVTPFITGKRKDALFTHI